jgi:peptide/nickel transport system substrate-binding protein
VDKELSRRELLAGAAVGVPALLAAKRLSGLHLPESISGLYPAGGILSSPPTGSKAKRGGSLHIGVAEIVEDINPYKAGLYQWLQFVALTVYEPLVTYSGSGQVIPVLAESFEEPDEKTTTFHLRQGVTFHNGASFSADDVVAAFQNYNNPKLSSGAVLPGGVFAGIQKVNQYTVTVKTKSSFRAVDYLRWLFIPPKNMTTQQLSTQAVGTGPFIFESFTPGNQFVVKRNPQYWQSGQPYLDGITFEFLQNASIQIANLRSGEVDYLFDVPVNLVKEVQGGNGTSLVQSTKFFHWWDVQLLDGPLASRQARQALKYAFNKPAMNEIAWGGKGISTWNPFIETPYAINNTYSTPYDPDKAKSLLQAAGAGGATIPINVLEGSLEGPLEAPVMQQGFEAAGLKAPIVILNSATWQSQAYVNRNFNGLIENYGTIPFPFSLIGSYMFSPFVAPLGNKPSPLPSVYNALVAAESAVTTPQVQQTIVNLQKTSLQEVACYHTFLAYNYQLIPSNLYNLSISGIGDVKFNSAYLA